MRKIGKLKIVLGAFLGIAFFILCFIGGTLWDAIDYKRQIFEDMATSKQMAISIWENESAVQRSDLELFHLFALKERPFEQLIAEKVELQQIERGERGVLYALEDQEIPGPYRNTCSNVYCYQIRLPFPMIPVGLLKTLIGVEDTRYLNHPGVDVKSLARAAIVDLMAMSFVQGGSTLTQQVIKNIFLTNEKSLIRKFKEMVLSIYLEQELTKEEIIALYLNEVFWGSLAGIKIKGFASASLFYFAKHPGQLTEYEQLILISMLKGPNYFRPTKHWARLKNRVDSLAPRLKEVMGMEFKEAWSELKWKNWSERLRKKSRSPHYRALFEIGRADRGSSLNVFESFRIRLSAHRVLRSFKERKDLKGKDLAVKILVRDLNCQQDCRDLKFYSKYERSLKTAFEAERHQIGSLVKPLVYQFFRKSGMPFDLPVSTEPIVFNLKSGVWKPRDASSSELGESIPMIEGLKLSRNIPTLRLARQYGIDRLEKDLDFYLPRLLSPLSEYPSQLLGALELSLTEVAGIYQKWVEQECQSPFAETILAQLSNPREVTIRRIVNDELADFRFFGKTGTTNRGLDNWYASVTGGLLSIIWVGLEGDRVNQKMRMAGATSSFRIFQDYILRRGRRLGDLSCEDPKSGLAN